MDKQIIYSNIPCKCGCEKFPKQGNFFINGHQNTGENNPSKQLWVKNKLSDIHKKLWKEGKEKGNTGNKYTEEIRNKISDSLKGRDSWNKGLPCTYSNKISEGLTLAILQNDGISFGFKGLVKGYFYSFKNNKEIFYGSSYELQSYKILEDSTFVKSYDRCKFFIPYVFEGNNKRYIPDIVVEYITGIKEIIEIKPSNLLMYKKNPFKFEALKNYCEERKLKYSIWTELELEII